MHVSERVVALRVRLCFPRGRGVHGSGESEWAAVVGPRVRDVTLIDRNEARDDGDDATSTWQHDRPADRPDRRPWTLRLQREAASKLASPVAERAPVCAKNVREV